MRTQFDEKKVEPNSGLGKAFLHAEALGTVDAVPRAPGAPIDNNLCERALKMAIIIGKIVSSIAPCTAPISVISS